ncbi:hypothetical protein EOM09_04360 [bacterium]|nr:hypothetical protein [bacterium]
MVYVKKTRKVIKRPFFLASIQYVLSVFIVVAFILSLIPNFYDRIYIYLLILVLVQIILSVIRFKLLNVFFEIFLLALIIVGLIPYLGWLFRFLGVFISLIDMLLLKESKFYKMIEIRTIKRIKKPKFNNSSNVKDANFKEKE